MFSYTKLMQAMVAAGAVSANDPYFNLVTLLLPGNGTNGAQNNTFLDSSTNNFTITRNGNTTQGTFSPFSQTGWGNYFNGTTDYLLGGNSTAYTLGTGDFSIEFFLFPTSSGSNGGVMGSGGASAGTFQIFYTTTKTIKFNCYLGTILETVVTCEPNVWNHVVITRSSSNARIFINGTLRAYGAFSDNIGGADLSIGRSYFNLNQEYFPGYLSNVRFIKGSIPTTYQTSSTTTGTSIFTSPTAALTTTSQGATGADVSILTCQSNRFVDNSTTSVKTITVGGTPSVQAFSPFAPTAAYDAATVGGSGYFDGNGDYLGLPNNSAFTFNSDFTIESWIYISSYPSGDAFIATGNVPGSWGFSCNSSGQLSCDDRGSGYINSGATLLPKNAWTHVAWSHVGTTTSDALYINGIRVATGSGRSFSNTVTAPTVGSSSGGNFPFPGYISNLRILKGTALYSGASFTVPTSLLTNITNTSLLLNFANAGITDATAKNVLETVGNAQISTTQSKFGGSSMYFDGTGDRLYFADGKAYVNGTEPFTLECWVNLGGTPNFWTIFGSSSSNGLLFTVQSLTAVIVNPSGLGNTVSGTTSLTAGTWFHLALTRNSANRFDIWVNGASIGNATSTQSFGTPTMFVIGAADNSGGQQFNGYLDDVRISKFCRYTTTFTPPTAAFALQ